MLQYRHASALYLLPRDKSSVLFCPVSRIKHKHTQNTGKRSLGDHFSIKSPSPMCRFVVSDFDELHHRHSILTSTHLPRDSEFL